MEPTVLLIEACNFENFPIGGQLSFCKHLLQVFGERFALVGISTDDGPIGKWTKRQILGHSFWFFSVGKNDPSVKKPLVPRRVSAYIRLRRYKKQILSLGPDCAFILAPEMMLAVRHWSLKSICYKFSGTENPLDMPRYQWAKALAKPFDKSLFLALRDKADLILAAADKEAIAKLMQRSKGMLDGKKLVQFPTRVDTEVFRVNRGPSASPLRASARPVFVTCGRINRVKGWELIIDAFCLVRMRLPAARLCFVGDGEDYASLKSSAARAGVLDAVTITGFKSPKDVAEYLNCADVFVLGSYREGWSIALLEALACGLPIVTSDVSGVKEVIAPGLNGYVVLQRDPVEYADKMLAALQLQCPNMHSLSVARHYSIDTLQHDLESLWKPLRL